MITPAFFLAKAHVHDPTDRVEHHITEGMLLKLSIQWANATSSSWKANTMSINLYKEARMK